MNKIIKSLIIILILFINNAYTKPISNPILLPTKYDKKQDKHIDKNIKNINKETVQRKNQDSILNSSINTNLREMNNLDNRINNLEETQYILGLKGRIYDSRKWEINIFADYSTNRNKIDRTGIRFTYKFGKSYEEKEINKLKKLIEELK